VRFSRTASQAALPDQSIAFESCEVSANGVVGEIEFSRKLLDGARRAAQKRNDLPARTVEKPFIEGNPFHLSPDSNAFLKKTQKIK